MGRRKPATPVWEKPGAFALGLWWSYQRKWMPPEISRTVLELSRRYQLASRFIIVAALNEGLPRVTPGGLERALKQISTYRPLRWSPVLAGVRWKQHAAFQSPKGLARMARTNGSGPGDATGNLPADRTGGESAWSPKPASGRRRRVLAGGKGKIQTCQAHRWIAGTPFLRFGVLTPKHREIFIRWWETRCSGGKCRMPWTNPRRIARMLGLPKRHPGPPRHAA
jgi:hypothetical protein